MLKRLKRLPRRLASELIPINWYARSAPLNTVSLYYHSVSDSPPHHQKLYRIKTKDEFRQDLEWLGKTFGFTDYKSVATAFGADDATTNLALLTFDDGFIECSHTIAPILREFSAPAIFFITTGYLNDAEIFVESRVSLCIQKLQSTAPDTVATVLAELMNDKQGTQRREHLGSKAIARFKRLPVVPPLSKKSLREVILWLLMTNEEELETLGKVEKILEISAEEYVKQNRIFMSEKEVAQLASEGFTIGAHSVRHRHLQDLSELEQRREILDSCDRIRQITGHSSIPFSFPYSARGISDTVLDDIRRKNPFVGLYFDTGGLRGSRPSMVRRCGTDFPETGVGKTLAPLLKRFWFI